ncbi:MAG TPA: response regulator transcription factor [Xanthobacteraceae bacterium]|jgi:FixJ family two-component response regulator|nr:response regulator transcription factor [Xanthobacteraceae bacterium]
MSERGTIHIIDDDESLRFSLRSLFRASGLQASDYASVGDFLKAPMPTGPTCLLLDVRLPGMNGLDFQARLADHGIRSPVVIMTGHGDIPMSVRGMKAGAVDFLTKPFREQDMLDAVTAALDRDRSRLSLEAADAELRERYATLSPREQQVMRLVTAGMMNKQVANALKLSEVTVKIHRGSAMHKMAARSLADLVKMAEALGLS